MWISRAHFDLIRERIAGLEQELADAGKKERDHIHEAVERMKAFADERFKVLAESLAESRNQFDQRIVDKDSVIRSQEARLAVLETERRELTDKLWTREQERAKPPEAMPAAPEDTWEAIMRKQIEEMAAPEAQ